MSHLNTVWTVLRFNICGKCDEKNLTVRSFCAIHSDSDHQPRHAAYMINAAAEGGHSGPDLSRRFLTELPYWNDVLPRRTSLRSLNRTSKSYATADSLIWHRWISLCEVIWAAVSTFRRCQHYTSSKHEIREACIKTDQEILRKAWQEAEYRFDIAPATVALILRFINE